MREKLGLSTRDALWLGTLIVGWIANYAAVTTRLSSVERTVERIEARVWELRGSRSAAFLGLVPEPCAPDATAVRLTMTEVDYGQDR